MTKTQIPSAAMKYFRLTGKEGGKARAAKYPKEQLSTWGKLGGRPRRSDVRKESR